MKEHTAVAKVVVLGDHAIGKSTLALVLSRQPWQLTQPTVSTKVITLALSDEQTRQTAIWDLVGRPGSRAVQQLHLSGVAAALIVFDAWAEDPLDGVMFWARALARSRELEDSGSTPPMKIYLVASRTDSGQIDEQVRFKRLRASALTVNFEDDVIYMTSAKNGDGILELRQAIHDGIDWEGLPAISAVLLDRMEKFLSEEKQQGRFIARLDDLRHSYRRAATRDADNPAVFADCLCLAENKGHVRLLRESKLVVLEPELVDNYAIALLNAAKDEPDGFGVLAMDNLRDGLKFRPEQRRLPDEGQERQLLESVVAELERRGLATRQNTEHGAYLAVPAQPVRRSLDPQLPVGSVVKFLFEGEPTRIFATLAARLITSSIFVPTEREPGDICCTFKLAEGECGTRLRATEDDRGELVIWYNKNPHDLIRRQFEDIIHGHLMERADKGTVVRLPVVSCPKCRYLISDDDLIRRKIDRGDTTIRCPDCDKPDIVLSVASTNNTHRVDVFLSYHSEDFDEVNDLYRRLSGHDFKLWLDKKRMEGGRYIDEQLLSSLYSCKSSVFFIGPHGLGDWQKLELKIAVERMAKEGHHIIPVFLTTYDGKTDIGPLGFARLAHYIDMRESDPDPFEKLVRAIDSRDEP